MPLKSNSAPHWAIRCAVAPDRSRVCAVLRRPSTNGQTALALARWQGGQFKELARVRGPMLAGMALDQFGRLFFRSSSCLTRPSAPAPRRPDSYAAHRGTPAVGRHSAGRRLGSEHFVSGVIVQSPAESLVAMEPTGKAGAPVKERWRVPGRARYRLPKQFGPRDRRPRRDGRRQVLYASARPRRGRLNAMDLQGASSGIMTFRVARQRSGLNTEACSSGRRAIFGPPLPGCSGHHPPQHHALG